MIAADGNGCMRAHEIDDSRGLGTVIHQITQHPQFVVLFRECPQ
jgi:hypothetical protein